MAKLLETWLNNEVNMSRRVASFEEDFSNGYLLGELLYKFNQQSDFDSFIDKHERIHRLNNFVRLIPSFKALQLKFDTILMHKIMNKAPGAAETLLYQIKMALEKTNAPIDVTIAKKAGQIIEQTPVQRIRPARPQFDEMEEKNYILTLQRLHRSQKDIDIDKKLQKYVDEAARIQDRAEKRAKDSNAKETELKDEKRKAMINKLQRNAGFMEDWEQKGVEEWKKNMETKKKREQMELKYKIKRAETMKTRAEGMHSEAKAETMQGIEDFERNLAKMGISTRLEKTAEPRPALIQPPAPLQEYTIKPPEAQERDIKRRTMAARLYNIEKTKERAYRADALVKKLDILSGREEVLAADIWSTTHYTELIMAHRKLRETRYERRRDYDSELAQLKESQALNHHILATQTEVELELDRGRQYSKAVSTLNRAARSESCQEMVELVVNLMQEISAFQEMTDLETTDSGMVGNWMTLFGAGIPADRMGSEDAELAIRAREIKEYIQGGGGWHSQVTTEAGTFVSSVNYYLTTAVEDLINRLFPATEEKITLSEPAKLPIKVTFIGYPYSGETTQANRLRSKHNIEVIDVLKLLHDHVDELQGQLEDGNPVDEDFIAGLVLKQLEGVSGKGWALVNYPDKAKQAEALERFLTGHTDSPQESEASSRLSALYEISPPREAKEQQIKRFPSGLDYVFWIKASKEECLRRCFGMRIDPHTGLTYHVEDDPPPTSASPLIESLQVIDKWPAHRGTLIDRMIAMDRNIADLKEYLSYFGTNEPLLITIDGDQTIEEIGQIVDSFILKLLKNREVTEAKAQEAAKAESEAWEKAEIARTDFMAAKQERLQMFAEDEMETAVAVDLGDVTREQGDSSSFEALFQLWEQTRSRYRERLFWLFEQKRKQRFEFICRYNGLQAGFLKYLYRPSIKSSIVLDFQLQYNAFIDQNPDMLEDSRSLEELHQRVDDLCNKLCDINDQRMVEAEQECTEVIEGENITTSIQLIISTVVELMQTEVNRYQATLLLLEDYYLMKQGLPLKGNLDAAQVVIDVDDPVPADRLAKVVEKAMKVTALTKEEILDPKAKKKEEKKQGAKGKGVQLIEEEVVKVGPLQEELNSALKSEEEIFKFRIQRLAKWAELILIGGSTNWDETCQKMRTWIKIFGQAENQVVQELSSAIKSNLENRSKLQPLILMNLLEVKIDKDQLVFMNPPIEPGPPKEFKYPNRFSISQLESIIEELHFLGFGAVQKVAIFSIFQRRKNLSKALDDRGGLPEAWVRLTAAQLIDVVNRFDPTGTGYIDSRAVANSLCLITSLPVDSERLKEYKQALDSNSVDNKLTLKQFLQVRNR